MGNTIYGKCAIECSKECSIWDKRLVVVGLSRNQVASDVTIVGNKKFAINKLWEVITVGDMWTNYVETLLDKLTIKFDGHSQQMNLPRDFTFNYADVFPFRVADIVIPSSTAGGYVYFLVSVSDQMSTSMIEMIHTCESNCLQFYRLITINAGDRL